MSALNIRKLEEVTAELKQLKADANSLYAEIARLSECLKKANDQAEHFERLYLLCTDDLEGTREQVARLEGALRHVDVVMGPVVPPCCDGCNVEWGEALRTVQEALNEGAAKGEQR